MKNAKYFLRKQGKSDPVIVFQVFDSRFKGRKFMYSTGHHIAPDRWSKAKERPKDNRALTVYLDGLIEIAKEYFELRFSSKTLSREDFKNFILYKLKDEEKEHEVRQLEKKDKETFYQQWQQIIDTTKTKLGEPISHDTKRQKKQTLKLVQKFDLERGLNLSFSSLDLKFYHAFDLYMIEKNLGPNSRGKQFKEIKAMLREAAERDYPVNNSYLKKSWKVIKKDSESVFLNTLEIRKLYDLGPDKLTPEQIRDRDIFVMACFVGARHSDWKFIRKENIITEGKTDLLHYKQTKTKEFVYVPIHSVVRQILSKYPKASKVITNQRFNDSIKEIARAAELGKCLYNGQMAEKADLITTHTARRSFATNAYLSKSMDVYQIMKCTGHKTESSFLKYLKLNGRDHAALAAESKFFTEDWSPLKKMM